MSNNEVQRRIVCAANKYGDLIFSGVRHFCPVMRQNMAAYDIEELRAERGEIQGFIDQHGVFLTREEAWVVAYDADQIVRRVGGDDPKLFSENLY